MPKEFGSLGKLESPKVVSSHLIPRCEGAMPPNQVDAGELPRSDKLGKNVIVEIFDNGKTKPIGCDYYKAKECQILETPLPCKYDTDTELEGLTRQRRETGIEKLTNSIEVPSVDSLRKTLVELREERGLTVTALSRIADLSNTTIFSLEKGLRPGTNEIPVQAHLSIVQRVIDVYGAEIGLKFKEEGVPEVAADKGDIFGQFRERRQSLRKTQKEVAEALDTNVSAILRLEKNKTDPPVGLVIGVTHTLNGVVEIRPKAKEMPSSTE